MEFSGWLGANKTVIPGNSAHLLAMKRDHFSFITGIITLHNMIKIGSRSDDLSETDPSKLLNLI